MPFNGSGTFSIINTFVPNSTILSSAVNSNNTDIASGLSDCLTRDGQAGMTANLSLGGHIINNLDDPVTGQDAATKAYVDSQNNAVWSTGDVKMTYKQVADAGWILFIDGTIGDASSGANVASATTAALFTLLYNSPFTDSSCPIFTSTGAATTRAGQGTAAAAYAAHCRLATPAVLGRAMAVAGSGSLLTTRVLGTVTGAETTTLITANLPPYTPGGAVNSTVSGGTVAWNNVSGSVVSGGAIGGPAGDTVLRDIGVASSFTGGAQGGTSTAFSQMQPSTFMNVMVKL